MEVRIFLLVPELHTAHIFIHSAQMEREGARAALQVTIRLLVTASHSVLKLTFLPEVAAAPWSFAGLLWHREKETQGLPRETCEPFLVTPDRGIQSLEVTVSWEVLRASPCARSCVRMSNMPVCPKGVNTCKKSMWVMQGQVPAVLPPMTSMSGGVFLNYLMSIKNQCPNKYLLNNPTCSQASSL